jgi:hypothetical protein
LFKYLDIERIGSCAQHICRTIKFCEEEVEPWTGDINLHVVKKIQSSSSLSEIPGLPSLKSKRQRRSVIAASSKIRALHGLLNLDKMLAYGAVSLKMNVAHSSAVLREIVRA